jgi:hypothetical protein
MVELSFEDPDLCDCLSFDGWRCVSCGHLLARTNVASATEPSQTSRETSDVCPVHPAGHSPIVE